MSKNKSLALITAFGGINAAGRSSSHLNYKNLIFDSLDELSKQEVLQDLAVLEGKIEPVRGGWETNSGDSINLKTYLSEHSDQIRSQTMVREIVREEFDIDRTILDQIQVSSAGMLPNGFDPSNLYPARHHPRALQLTVFGMSDALGQLGIEWSKIQDRINPDEVAVFSGAAIGQMDKSGFAGLMQSRLKGSRASSKNLPLGLVEMSADFINAYVLGSVGRTGHCVGACATFLYNLQLGKEAIENGTAKVVIVGGAEAPITPETMDGFYAMSALANDTRLLELQAKLNEPIEEGPNQRFACRPFGENVGMVLGESSQFIILMEDKLALDLGAEIYGSVASVFSHADGFKSSISGPGIGNYITMTKCTSETVSLIGLKNLRFRSFVHAHGTGTPANRTTESHILNEIAKLYNIKSWPVTAIKSYLGHSMAPASGDQCVTSLGTWNKGIIPKIHSVKKIAKDVHQSNLDFLLEHKIKDPDFYKVAFLNAKGFGGNNASAAILSPKTTKELIKDRYPTTRIRNHSKKVLRTKSSSERYNSKALKGEYKVIYKFNEKVLQGETDIKLDKKEIRLKGFAKPIKLN